jgi:TolB-like protein
VTTVRRWERKERLPVHRKIHDKLGSVYAYKAELDHWWHIGQDRPHVSQGQAAGISTASVAIEADATRLAPPATIAGAGGWLTRPLVIAVPALVTVALVAWYSHQGFRAEATDPETRLVRTLAVLPLENLTGDEEQEYFVDGITDALTGTFSQMGAIRVVSGTSARRYKGTSKPAPEIARELGGVDALLEGTVLRSGNRVKVTAALIHAATDRRVWTGTYERDIADVFALYSDLGQAVAREISVVLGPPARERLNRSRTLNADAYDSYDRVRTTPRSRSISNGSIRRCSSSMPGARGGPSSRPTPATAVRGFGRRSGSWPSAN